MSKRKELKPDKGCMFVPQCIKCDKQECKVQVGEALKSATLLYCKYKNK